MFQLTDSQLQRAAKLAADGVLRITFDAPGLNPVGPDAHREIADIWLTVDRDPDVRVAVLQGTGGVTLSYEKPLQ